MNDSIKMGALAGRAIAFATTAVDADTRTIDVAFSSEAPVERVFGRQVGDEVLDHASSSVRLDRLREMGPLLLEHDPAQHVGTVESVEIGADRRGRARVRFGSDELAERAYRQVKDGVKRAVSVGYRILKLAREGETVFRAIDWEPFEISLVAIPADTSVGVGRDLDSDLQKVMIMTTDKEPREENRAVPAPAPNVSDRTNYEADIEANAKAAGLQAERDRAGHISLLGKQYNVSDLADTFIRNGKSVDEFKEAVMASRNQRQASYGNLGAGGESDIGLTEREIKDFSFLRAINALADPNNREKRKKAGFEFACSQAAQEKFRSGSSGIMLPNKPLYQASANGAPDMPTLRVPSEVLTYKHSRAALEVGTANAAGDLVATNLLAQSFIDILRNRTLTINENALNVQFLQDLNGDVAIPTRLTSSGFGWIATEGAAAAEAVGTVGTVTLAPKNAGVYKDFTRQLLLQSSVDVENFVRTDLADQAAVGMDLAVLYGTGATGQPTGIANAAGIGSVTFATPATPTWDEIVEFETDVESGNALMGSLAYVTTPSIRGTLKTTAKDAGSGLFLWEGGVTGNLNGYPAYSTNQVTAGDVLYGNFRDCLVGMWGGIDLMVDPYSLSTTGSVRVVLLLSMDVAIRHAASFSLGN